MCDISGSHGGEYEDEILLLKYTDVSGLWNLHCTSLIFILAAVRT
jgi:hypothetical protein